MIRNCIFVIVCLLGSYKCKYSDLRIGKLQRDNQFDYYYSRMQYQKFGIAGYCKIFDESSKKFLFFPYTFKIQTVMPRDYYIYHDAVWLGTGTDYISDTAVSIIKPLPIR